MGRKLVRYTVHTSREFWPVPGRLRCVYHKLEIISLSKSPRTQYKRDTLLRPFLHGHIRGAPVVVVPVIQIEHIAPKAFGVSDGSVGDSLLHLP
jgi:hypothetical protein